MLPLTHIRIRGHDQLLTCCSSSPVGVSTWKTPPKAPNAHVGNTFEERLATDMKIMTTCRDFDRIMEWANERVVEGWIDAT
jgi:hypothetical protein